MLFSLTMFPIGHGESLCRPVSEVVDQFDRAGLKYQVTGMDTILEGEWEEVMPIIKHAEEHMRSQYGRVYMTLAIDDRVGAKNRLHGAVADVERELARDIEHV